MSVLDALLDSPRLVLAERAFAQKKREQLAKSGHALSDGSYPIETVGDLENAKQAFGRAPTGKRAELKRHINRWAKKLGAPPLGEAFAGSTSGGRYPNAAQAALQYGGKAPAPSAPGSGVFDESKHKRAPAGAAGGGRFISTGSRGVDVQAVQHRVGATPDGKFGAQTRQRVMDFQRQHGLQVDGVVGAQTALALAGHYRQAKATAPGPLGKASRSHLRSTRKGGASMRARTRAPRTRGGIVV